MCKVHAREMPYNNLGWCARRYLLHCPPIFLGCFVESFAMCIEGTSSQYPTNKCRPKKTSESVYHLLFVTPFKKLFARRSNFSGRRLAVPTYLVSTTVGGL